MEYSLIRLTNRLEVKAQAAAWFHAKWGVPEQAYLDSMDDALREAGPVPQWYLVLESSRIIGGMGVIENDFHDRKDLTPNVCAVYAAALRARFYSSPAGICTKKASIHSIC